MRRILASRGRVRSDDLARQAVTQRIRELQRRGVIRGYRADIDPAALGLTVRAEIRLALDGAAGARREKDL